jgi:hypothetical protein
MCLPFVFSIQEFFICLFCCKKPAFVCEFHIPPCGNWCFSQGSTPLVGMKFCENVLDSLRNKNLKRHIPIYLKKWFFWPLKHCNPPGTQGNKTFSSTLNVMISQMVRNECLRFRVHVNIQVSYKSLLLKIPKEVLILHQPPGFQEGYFEAILTRKHPSTFRG